MRHYLLISRAPDSLPGRLRWRTRMGMTPGGRSLGFAFPWPAPYAHARCSRSCRLLWLQKRSSRDRLSVCMPVAMMSIGMPPDWRSSRYASISVPA